MELNDYRWATHLPLIQALKEIESFDIAVELGTGLFSTPLLVSLPSYIGIENDEEWHVRMTGKFPDADIRHHILPNKTLRSRYRSLTVTEKIRVIRYYMALSEAAAQKTSFLLIDGFPCTRSIALQVLKDSFDCVLFHDAQPSSEKCYGYLEVDVGERHCYYLTSPTSWTGLLIKEDRSLELKEALPPYIAAFKKRWNLPPYTDMQLIQKI